MGTETMKEILSGFIILLSFAAAAPVVYSADNLNSEIKNLPGLQGDPGFRMFSGYIPVDIAKTRSIFYWFVESARDPKNDPVVLWTNGGPGCSGVTGFMTELGPFRPTANGTLEPTRAHGTRLQTWYLSSSLPVWDSHLPPSPWSTPTLRLPLTMRHSPGVFFRPTQRLISPTSTLHPRAMEDITCLHLRNSW